MGLRDFFEYSLPNMQDHLEDLKEIWRDGKNELRSIIRESKEDLREGIEEDAYSVNYELGQFVENFHNVERKVEGKIENFAETLRNVQHSKEGKCVLCNGEYDLADHLLIGGLGGERDPSISGLAIVRSVRGLWTHHGIYVGGGNVIHYNYDDCGDLCVHEVSVSKFANGKKIYKFTTDGSPIRFSAEEAVRRARSKLGESEYNLLFNNCENFVRWCRFGVD